MNKQECLNDIVELLNKLILRAVNQNRSIYIISFRTFAKTRLNQSVDAFTTRALYQVHDDLANLCKTLNQELFKDEIELLEMRANEIKKMV